LRRNAWLIQTQSIAAEVVRPEDAKSAPPEIVPVEKADTFSFDGRTIDFANLELRSETGTIQLTLMEAKLLRHLVQNTGQTVSRKSILEDVWGLHEDTDTRAIDNFIVRLRRYIEADPSKPQHLLTVRGVGYKFVG
jgi:DNA-binding response OmpR family regulator